MKAAYSPRHAAHEPRRELALGAAEPAHEIPARAEAIRAALDEDGGFEWLEVREHGLGPIEAVHDATMVRFVERAWRDWQRWFPEGEEAIPWTFALPSLREGMEPFEPSRTRHELGWWCFDTGNPFTAGAAEAARASVDVALTAAGAILVGERAAYGLCRPPGHHAARAVFGGFCFFNNAGIAAQHLLDAGASRVALLDVDYHHGNGTQQLFYGRADVLTASVHADPVREFPYFTGFADEVGTGAGRGTNLNVPLPAGVGDDEFLAAVESALERLAPFAPEILVVPLGVDTFRGDPLGDFDVGREAYHRLGRLLAGVGLPTLVLQEGGYAVAELGANVRDVLRGLDGR